MAKQSIFGRISTLVKANINAMLDQAEDPQKMLDQLVRDYTNNIADAEAAIAETIGNLRLLERDHQEDLQSASDWGNKALAASRKADEFRAAGDSVDADKFDNLAKVALQRQIAAENSAKAAAPQIASQTEVDETARVWQQQLIAVSDWLQTGAALLQPVAALQGGGVPDPNVPPEG